MAMYRSCVCLELNKLKNPLKCRRAVRKHPRVIIAGVAGDCSLGPAGRPNIAGAASARKFLRHRRS